jgi:hypothetical protein
VNPFPAQPDQGINTNFQANIRRTVFASAVTVISQKS